MMSLAAVKRKRKKVRLKQADDDRETEEKKQREVRQCVKKIICFRYVFWFNIVASLYIFFLSYPTNINLEH